MKEVTIKKILEILNINIGIRINKEQLDDDLTKVGLDSIAFIRAVVSLEEEFQCEVPDSKLLITEMNTINKIFDVLESIEKKVLV